MNTKSALSVYLPVLLAMVFWSYSFIWYKEVLVFYRPIALITFRLVLAVPLLFLLSVALRKLQHIKRKDLAWFLLLGFFEPFLYFMGESYGMKLVSPTLAAIIISLIPLLAPIPAWFIFRERFTLTNYIGLFISVAGVILVIMGENTHAATSLAGVLLMLLAVFAAVLHSVVVRKLAGQYNSFTIVTYQSLFGLIYFLPLFGIMEFSGFIQITHRFEMVWPVVKLAVFASTFAFLFFVYSIQRLGIVRTNVFVNLIPVFTAILSYFILKEQFGVMKMVGIAVVIAGLVFSQLNRRSRMMKRSEL